MRYLASDAQIRWSSPVLSRRRNQDCAWPGNFRQLGNLLRTAAAMVDADAQIRREHLPEDFFDDLDNARTASPGTIEAVAPLNARLQDVAVLAITAAVAEHHGNVSAAARALGISRNTIYRKMPVAPCADD